MKTPLVSVLMTAYNREQYIAEAIESVLKSDFQDFELIIVDDCSKDRTVAIAKCYAERDPRITVYINEKNLGDYGNRNKAASYARGKYLKSLDSDDYLLAGGLNYCVQSMERHPEADWALSCHVALNSPTGMDPEEAIRTHFFKQPFLVIGPGGTIIKRSFFERIGGYPEKYGPANDMYFNLKAAANGRLLLLKEEFMHYRIHEGQEINNKSAYLFNVHRYMRDVLEEVRFPLTASELKWLRKKANRKFLTKLWIVLRDTKSIKDMLQLASRAQYSVADALDGLIISPKLLK